MKQIKSFIRLVMALVIIALLAGFVIAYYPWVFSKRVKGEILDVQRVTNPSAIINSRVTEAQIHSYSILIQGDDGKLYATSSEDRQWQVAAKGYCVVAILYRYPFWDLEKADTFFNARIVELSLCPGQTAPPVNTQPGGNVNPQPLPGTEPVPAPGSTPAPNAVPAPNGAAVPQPSATKPQGHP